MVPSESAEQKRQRFSNFATGAGEAIPGVPYDSLGALWANNEMSIAIVVSLWLCLLFGRCNRPSGAENSQRQQQQPLQLHQQQLQPTGHRGPDLLGGQITSVQLERVSWGPPLEPSSGRRQWAAVRTPPTLRISHWRNASAVNISPRPCPSPSRTIETIPSARLFRPSSAPTTDH